MAKRLRGFHLEKALQVPKKVPKKTVGSALATALLSLWCHGKVSGTTMRWLAESALLDGAQHDELVLLATLFQGLQSSSRPISSWCPRRLLLYSFWVSHQS